MQSYYIVDLRPVAKGVQGCESTPHGSKVSKIVHNIGHILQKKSQKACSGYKVGHPGHSKYVWMGQYEPSCLKVPSSVL